MNKTEYLLVLLCELVIDTHNYVDLDKYKKRLEKIKEGLRT